MVYNRGEVFGRVIILLDIEKGIGRHELSLNPPCKPAYIWNLLFSL